MITIVITTGILGFILCAGIGAWQIAEATRKKTEKAIAIYYRDHQTDCVMMLNRISLIETRKEIAKQQLNNEISKNS
jgi:hypothetical protein